MRRSRHIGRTRALLLLAAAAPALAGAGCYTVDLGMPPSDINACRPSQSYYVYGTSADGGVSDADSNQGIWTEVLTHDFGGRHCVDTACHGSGSTNSLKLATSNCQPFNAAMPCNPPIPLTQEWADDYRATAEQMNCSSVMASKLLAKPTGQLNHFPGKLFDLTDKQAGVIIGWVGALP
jgi:hypothetical protein